MHTILLSFTLGVVAGPAVAIFVWPRQAARFLSAAADARVTFTASYSGRQKRAAGPVRVDALSAVQLQTLEMLVSLGMARKEAASKVRECYGEGDTQQSLIARITLARARWRTA